MLYKILMGAPQGPRLGPYVLTMGKQNVVAALQRALVKPKIAIGTYACLSLMFERSDKLKQGSCS